jgi:hypothetical protein
MVCKSKSFCWRGDSSEISSKYHADMNPRRKNQNQFSQIDFQKKIHHINLIFETSALAIESRESMVSVVS